VTSRGKLAEAKVNLPRMFGTTAEEITLGSSINLESDHAVLGNSEVLTNPT
jgi:hypothetical protein